MWKFLLVPALAFAASPDDLTFFESKVRPLLAAHCHACHGSKAKIAQANVRLDTRDGAMAVVTPGDPSASKLIQAVRHETKPTMPPSGKLTPEQIAVLEEWVKRGAPWPEEAKEARTPVPGKPTADRSKHWSFQPVRRVEPPVPRDGAWSNQPVDRFLLHRLEREGIAPNGPAEPATLLRRLSFDLTGLPPSPAAVEAFLSDPSEAAYARIADALIASPEFGERWARHWLDVTYYGDTMDTAAGIPAPYAWRYRDWVVKAFQEDKPVNRFIAEQIAGDLMPARDRLERNDLITATGYLMLGPWALVQADKVQLRMDVVDFQLDGIGKGLLGLTLGCARCHDHKFDPVSQKEYYGLAGILASTRTVHGRWREAGVFSDINKVPLYEAPEQAEARKARSAEYERAIAEITARISELEAEQKKIANDASAKERLKALDSQLNMARRRHGMLEFNRPAPPVAYAAQDEETPGDTRITIRGNAHQLGDAAPRTFVKVAMFGESAPAMRSSGRLELARWISDDRNPLTPRVYVNRVWQNLFGRGLVASADNFGLRGDLPTHPELLDWLAASFLADGWSTKKLVRRIVMSRAYRMSAEPDEKAVGKDPENKLLWRMNRRRLEAEAIRDAVLRISGRFDPARGGYTLPTDSLDTFAPDLGKVNPPRMTNGGRLPEWLRYRRTIYMPVYRGSQMDELDILNLFDFANNAQLNASRKQTVVPTQALYLMNSPWLREEAQVLARRLLEGGTLVDHQRVERAIEAVFNRPAGKQEVTRALEFLYDFESAAGKPPGGATLEAWTRYIQTLFASNEFLFRS